MAAPCAPSDMPTDMTDLYLHSENVQAEQKTGICKLCLKARASYTCPRCNLSYCSLACYRSEKHVECSESFYKNNFIQALKETKGRSEDKKAVLEMLARLDAEERTASDSDDEDDDAETESLENRLAGLDLDKDPDKVWDKLTPQERHEFDEILRGGALGSMLEEWMPWWTTHDRELITEVACETKQPEKRKVTTCDPPKVLDSIPRLSDLIKTPPSPLIVYNLINVLYCYAFVTRLYNGSHLEIPLHAVQNFLEVCSVVSANASFSCTADSIQSADHTITQLKSVPSDRKHLVSVIQDVIHIMLGRGKSSRSVYVQSALSDLHELLRQTKAIYKRLPEAKQAEISKSKSAVFQAKRKVVFYLAWVRENQHTSILRDKAAEVKLLHGSMAGELQQFEQMKTGVEKNLQKVKPRSTKTLIEELN